MRKKEWKCVYVILFSDNAVKVGVTKDFEKRMKTHEANTHLKHIKFYVTDKCSNALQIETETKKHFNKYAKYGSEWLNAPFNIVKDFVKKTFDEIAEFTDTTSKDEESVLAFSKILKSIIDKGEKTINECREREVKILNKLSDYSNTQQETNKKLIDTNQKLIDCAVYAQNMLRYTLWYIEEMCKDNMMYSEFIKFRKDFSKTSDRIKRP